MIGRALATSEPGRSRRCRQGPPAYVPPAPPQGPSVCTLAGRPAVPADHPVGREAPGGGPSPPGTVATASWPTVAGYITVAPPETAGGAGVELITKASLPGPSVDDPVPARSRCHDAKLTRTSAGTPAMPGRMPHRGRRPLAKPGGVPYSAELDERSSQEGETVAAVKVDRRHGRACAGKPVSSSHLACLKKKKK